VYRSPVHAQELATVTHQNGFTGGITVGPLTLARDKNAHRGGHGCLVNKVLSYPVGFAD